MSKLSIFETHLLERNEDAKIEEIQRGLFGTGCPPTIKRRALFNEEVCKDMPTNIFINKCFDCPSKRKEYIEMSGEYGDIVSDAIKARGFNCCMCWTIQYYIMRNHLDKFEHYWRVK